VFADPSLLDAIVLDQPAPCQDGDAGGSASSAAPEAVEGVLGESAADAKSAAIEPPLTTTGETTDAPLLQPAEAAVAAPHLRWLARSRVLSEERGHHPLACCCFHGGGFGPIQPATVPQEHDAPEGATRAASQRSRRSERTGARPYREMSEAEMPGPSNLPAPRGRPPSRLATMSRTMRRP
jgi:hypothetical protein